MKTWLVIDVHFMCHRAFHTAQDLSWKGRPTGVVFGFLKSITSLKDEFQTDRIAFCFEHPHLFRRDIYPPYKRKRRTVDRTEQEEKAYRGLHLQIDQLRKTYLPRIGFKNVLCYRGMESDDIMAAIAVNAKEDEEVILVTADSDLLQCLRSNVSIYSPHARRVLTEPWFFSKYGFRPSKWAVVKAIAGCPSDEVRGIKGVGELTALKWVKGELKPSSKAYQAISCAEGLEIVRRNKRLVRLPYQGCPVPDLHDDEVDRGGWREVCGMLGMKSIAGCPPIATMSRGRI